MSFFFWGGGGTPHFFFGTHPEEEDPLKGALETGKPELKARKPGL